MIQPDTNRVLQVYGLRAKEVRPVQKGYRNHIYPVILTSGRTISLIIYKSEPDILAKIENAHYVSNYLASKRLPVRTTEDDRILQIQSPRHKTYGAIYNYLPGHTIPWEAYTMAHIKALGATMSDMHAHLAKLPRKKLPNITDEYHMVLTRMNMYFADQGVRQAMEHKLGLCVKPNSINGFVRLLQKLAGSPVQQPLHMDFVRGNILFDDASAIAGILDFEKAAYGDPLLDIARTLAFLLVDCKYKTEAKVRKYFLHSGYNKRGGSSFVGRSAELEMAVTLFLLYDFYKFLRHNPYEYLGQNEHYIRTRDFLLRQTIISVCPGAEG